MEKIRAFVALEMPEAIHRSLAEVSEGLKKELLGIPLRWVPVQNMHLTMKFLGEVMPDRVEEFGRVVKTRCAQFASFQISITGLGAFPSLRRARVIWVGIEAPQSLSDLVTALESDFATLGFQREKRPFSAHLTLARVREHAQPSALQKIYDVISSFPSPNTISAMANKVVLFRSELKPSGSVYNPLSQFLLS